MRLLTAAACVLVAACGGGVGGGPSAGQAAPLEALPDCSEPPAAAAEAPEGFVAPEGAVIQQVTPQEPLVNVTAYLPMTPGQARLAYEELEGIEVLLSEDEVFEAELLVSDGAHRTYVKATAICRVGSNLLAVVAPEAEAGVLPTPAGTPGAPPTGTAP